MVTAQIFSPVSCSEVRQPAFSSDEKAARLHRHAWKRGSVGAILKSAAGLASRQVRLIREVHLLQARVFLIDRPTVQRISNQQSHRGIVQSRSEEDVAARHAGFHSGQDGCWLPARAIIGGPVLVEQRAAGRLGAVRHGTVAAPT